MLWRSEDVYAGLSVAGSDNWQAERISIDSRNIAIGDLFVALKGDNFDGHDFIDQAVNAGAVAVIAEKSVPCKVPLLQVKDSLQALQMLARLARQRLDGTVIAVTGSVGKTTTKEMLIFALSQLGTCYGAGGNFNNHIGLPLTLVNCPLGQDFIVLEMGMNHAGEISLLTDIGKPDIAIITNVKPAHMMNFANLQAVADAKSEIFESSPKQALFIGDDEAISPYLREKSEQAGIADIRSFGYENCDYRLLSSNIVDGKNAITADLSGRQQSYSIGMLGEHAALNSLVTFAVADMLQASHEVNLLEEFMAPKGRGAVSKIKLKGGGGGGGGGWCWLIDESYNASPAAVSASIKLLSEFGEGRKVAILGDMLELGDDADDYHIGLAEPLKSCGIDKLVAIGDHMQKLYESVPNSMQLAAFHSTQDFLQEIYNYLEKNDIILVKASNSIGFSEVVEKLKGER